MQTKEAIETYLKEVGGDGHSIYKPEYLIKIGFSFEFVKKYAFKQKSGSGYKATIFDTKTGGALKELFGVYALTFVEAIAVDIGADTNEAGGYMGRGFQAQAYCRAIRKRLDELYPAAAPVPVAS